jgi:hypothetical protein
MHVSLPEAAMSETLGVCLFLSLRSLSDKFADAAISIIFSAGEASVKHSIVAEAELTDAG